MAGVAARAAFALAAREKVPVRDQVNKAQVRTVVQADVIDRALKDRLSSGPMVSDRVANGPVPLVVSAPRGPMVNEVKRPRRHLHLRRKINRSIVRSSCRHG